MDVGGVYITFQFGSVRPSCEEEHSPGPSGQCAPPKWGKEGCEFSWSSLRSGEFRWSGEDREKRRVLPVQRDRRFFSFYFPLFSFPAILSLFHLPSARSLSMADDNRNTWKLPSRFTVPGRSQQERSLCFNFDY